MSEVVPVEVHLPALTSDEDSFCLAVIEYGGNLGAAFRASFGADASNALARARLLITRPEIAKRIRDIAATIEDAAIISLGSHLNQLAVIRDLAVDQGDLKSAIVAEVKRGEAAGYYAAHKASKEPGEDSKRASVTINIGSTPTSVQDWAKTHGQAPLIIDMPQS